MRLLFVDDDPENVEPVANILRSALDAEVTVVATVEEAVAVLNARPYDLVVTDIFIPMGADARAAMGPRARRSAEMMEHMGGLVLLDEIERLDPQPAVLIHTACNDAALIEVVGGRVRVPKPAPPDRLLNAVLELIRPSSWP